MPTMLSSLCLSISLLSFSAVIPFAQSTSTMCAPCNSLLSRWNPTSDTGSCAAGNASNPQTYILNFQQCICSPDSLSDYTACASCNGNLGVPIDGLNFGPPASFSSACSVFSEDVTSILQPSGLNAFASAVRAAMSPATSSTGPADILGYYAFENVITQIATQISIVTDSTSFTPTRLTVATTATATPTPGSGSSGIASEGAGRSASILLHITAIFAVIVIILLL